MSLLEVVAFLTELASLAVLGVWGAHIGRGGQSWILALTAPLTVAAVWGVLLSPKAPISLPFTVSLGLKGLVFAVTSWASWEVWGGWATGLFAVAAALSLLADLK